MIYKKEEMKKFEKDNSDGDENSLLTIDEEDYNIRNDNDSFNLDNYTFLDFNIKYTEE
jgi:hypothetical protein